MKFQPGDSVWMVADDTVYPVRVYHAAGGRVSATILDGVSCVSAPAELCFPDELGALDELIRRRERQLLELVGRSARLRLAREKAAAWSAVAAEVAAEKISG
jgi:hypothetical protein